MKKMKMKDFVKVIDKITKIKLFTPDSSDESDWEGYLLDMPWIFLDAYIGRLGDSDEPVFLWTEKNKDWHDAGMTINIYWEEDLKNAKKDK